MALEVVELGSSSIFEGAADILEGVERASNIEITDTVWEDMKIEHPNVTSISNQL